MFEIFCNEAFMKELAAELHIDVEALERDLDFCTGVGQAYETLLSQTEDRNFEHVASIAATNFQRAACHAVLLDDPAAEKYFIRSAALYGKVNRGYSLMLRSFVDNVETLRPLARAAQDVSLEHHDVNASLIYASIVLAAGEQRSSNSQDERIRGELAAKEGTPLGVLGIPLGVYIDLCYGLQKRDDISILRSLTAMLSAYDFGLRRAMANHYHWRLLNMPFHPVQPDILSVLFLTESLLRRNDSSVDDVIERVPLSWATLGFVRQSIKRRFASGSHEM